MHGRTFHFICITFGPKVSGYPSAVDSFSSYTIVLSADYFEYFVIACSKCFFFPFCFVFREFKECKAHEVVVEIRLVSTLIFRKLFATNNSQLYSFMINYNFAWREL